MIHNYAVRGVQQCALYNPYTQDVLTEEVRMVRRVIGEQTAVFPRAALWNLHIHNFVPLRLRFPFVFCISRSM